MSALEIIDLVYIILTYGKKYLKKRNADAINTVKGGMCYAESTSNGRVCPCT